MDAETLKKLKKQSEKFLQRKFESTATEAAKPEPALEKAIEFLGEDVTAPGAKIYGFKAITVTTTGNGRKYTAQELATAARGLSFRALNINHDNGRTLRFPENSTLLTSFDGKENAVIGSMRIADKNVQSQIDTGFINKLSIEQIPQEGETCNCSTRVATGACQCEQHGVTLVGMALLTKDTPPGDSNTEIIKMESLVSTNTLPPGSITITATPGKPVTISGPITISVPAESAEPSKIGVEVPISSLIIDPHDVGEDQKVPPAVKGEPFAGYKDFDDCVSQNSDKENPQAYCGFIKNQAEKAEAVVDVGSGAKLFLVSTGPDFKDGDADDNSTNPKDFDGDLDDLVISGPDGEKIELNMHHHPVHGQFLTKDDAEAKNTNKPIVDRTKWMAPEKLTIKVGGKEKIVELA